MRHYLISSGTPVPWNLQFIHPPPHIPPFILMWMIPQGRPPLFLYGKFVGGDLSSRNPVLHEVFCLVYFLSLCQWCFNLDHMPLFWGHFSVVLGLAVISSFAKYFAFTIEIFPGEVPAASHGNRQSSTKESLASKPTGQLLMAVEFP